MNNSIYQKATPESQGIPSKAIINYLHSLESVGFPLHSAIIMRHNQILLETYYEPCTKDSLHRMFSITKSFVSIAIGLLIEEGRLNYEDKIVDYFMDKVPDKDTIHPYMAAMTIRDMLKMSSCHDKTTFKTMPDNDWVKTFFTVVPNHKSGMVFSYDTSSTHTLAALVERITGMDMLDYMRGKFLDEIGFSKDAYIMKDPVGVSMGGSGLMATTRDILAFIDVVAHNGVYRGKQLLPADYVQRATTLQISTYGKGNCWEEMQGYGYQFWCTSHNGFVCFGMGGQLAIYLRDQDITIVTTADAQGRQGGVQLIYDAFWKDIYPYISEEPLTQDSAAAKEYEEYVASRQLVSPLGNAASPIMDSINGRCFRLGDNGAGFKTLSISFDNTANTGTLKMSQENDEFEINFGLGFNVTQIFHKYNDFSAIGAAWGDDNTLLIRCNMIGESVGNILFTLSFANDDITVIIRKFEESLYKEFNLFVSGKAI